MQSPRYMCFVDFTKAFDMVKHNGMWLRMLEMGLSPHLVEILRKLYKHQSATVTVAGLMSTFFSYRKRRASGIVFSQYLFNIRDEMVMRRVLDGFNRSFRIEGRLINNLRYADDIILIATCTEDLQEIVSRLTYEAVNYNM